MRELLVDGRESQGDPIELECPLEMKRRGSEVRLILANHKEELAPVASLERVVARARDWTDRIASGEIYTQAQLIAYSGLAKQNVQRILRCAVLSPRMTEDILAGRHPVDLTVAALVDGLSNDWAEQSLDDSMCHR
jgi:hypothetical protein